ncbi:hypothetical protein [Plantactinospora endophytica]|uniref:Uncharacterized protein n=1 Tax=Plantactinospora endophytica TaxID=673535 RepID=A0ABQ4E3E5_9ACTN|nr:hypothetical protein [Plantactinospora endophytica]GIG89217.1 hypothetical protein Pen02_41530 [Plantactinospora endophytica]
MRWSELHGIRRTDQDDWFDTYLPTDTNLCVDPFLIYPDTDERWFEAHDHTLDFFALVFGLVRESKGNEKSLAWKQAQALLMFPEPAEFCLGVADGTPNGSGAGRGLQEGMLDGVKTALGLGIDNVPHMEMLGLFQGGMGLDRISDAVCNILKSFFIRYTQDIARRHGVPMKRFRVRNAAWSEEFASWQTQEVDLPANPFLDRPGPVLLVPKRFLKDIPVVSANGFWNYAWRNHSEEVRGNFNYLIARNVDSREKAKMARQNPAIVASYLKDLEHTEHEPYPVDKDPKLRTRWWEMGGKIAERSPLSYVPKDHSEFPEFVAEVIQSFRHGIEHQDEWQMLWHLGVSLPEKKVQALFRSCAKHYCKANDISMTGEANAGRGPVDFHFAAGWVARTVVEMKLMSNSKFWDGILAQTPQYAMSEDVHVAFFVAIAYTDDEMTESQTNKIGQAARIASDRYNVEIRPIVVDARPKQSASKMKPPQDLRDELHGESDKAA